MIKKIKDFFASVKAEFNKIQWPSKNQTIKATSIVILLVLITTIFLSIVDLGLGEIINQTII